MQPFRPYSAWLDLLLNRVFSNRHASLPDATRRDATRRRIPAPDDCAHPGCRSADRLQKLLWRPKAKPSARFGLLSC